MLALLALTLGLLDLTHVIRLWMVMVVAACFGLTNAVDNPARQAFVPEMVGADSVGNAVTLNSVMVNAARAVGPALAGILIVTAGVAGCFLVNAASFVAILVALATMNTSLLEPAQAVASRPGQLLEGLRYVRRTPRLLTPLLMMALIGALAYEFQVVLPLLAKRTFHGNADAYGYLTSAFGLGAVAGGIVVASRRSRGLRSVTAAAGAFGVTMLASAAAPTFTLELLALACTGAASVAFLAGGNTTLQLTAAEQMRGRVMALWAVAFIGTTPIGGPIVGYVAQHAGPRWGSHSAVSPPSPRRRSPSTAITARRPSIGPRTAATTSLRAPDRRDPGGEGACAASGASAGRARSGARCGAGFQRVRVSADATRPAAARISAMVPVARRNLFAEKGRFAMSVCGVAFAVLLILIVVSLYRGWSTTGSVYLDLPGNLWVAQAGTIDPFHSTSMLPAGKASQLHGIPGVVAAFPVYARHIAFPTRGGGRTTRTRWRSRFPPVRPFRRSRAGSFPLRVMSRSTRCSPARRASRPAAGSTCSDTKPVVDPLLPGGNKIVEFAFLNPADTRVLLGAPGYVSYYLLTTAPGAGLGSCRAPDRRAHPGGGDPHERRLRGRLQPDGRQQRVPERRRGARRYRVRRRRGGDRVRRPTPRRSRRRGTTACSRRSGPPTASSTASSWCRA